MIFTVSSSPPSTANDRGYLVPDNWDDWFSYCTLFHLIIFDAGGVRHDIGAVKIGQTGLLPRSRDIPAEAIVGASRSPSLESSFDALPNGYFSLGQEENYYEALCLLSDQQRAAVYSGLSDCAFDLALFNQYEQEDVMQQSLLRQISPSTVRLRLHRLAHGDAALTEFNFSYEFPTDPRGGESPVLDFHVLPNSSPPTNVHVLIGRNGVGKTRFMKGMASAVYGQNNEGGAVGVIRYAPVGADRFGFISGEWSFAGLVSVSFSAFDSFDYLNPNNSRIRLEYVGLNVPTPDADGAQPGVKTPQQLTQDFCNSFERCRTGLRANRWLDSVRALEVDPLFEEARIIDMLDQGDEDWRDYASRVFHLLSSGHKIVLLTITRLVELVDEKTLVLIDEPEGHLHPPLLAAFIRSLNNLLTRRNGVAIIATHSPVVLQEVPKSSVWKLNRSGHVSTVERPNIETFGENVGILTREVFGLEVTHSGFHQMIRACVEQLNYSYEQVQEFFGYQLGAEGSAIARALIAERDYQRGS